MAILPVLLVVTKQAPQETSDVAVRDLPHNRDHQVPDNHRDNALTWTPVHRLPVDGDRPVPLNQLAPKTEKKLDSSEFPLQDAAENMDSQADKLA